MGGWRRRRTPGRRLLSCRCCCAITFGIDALALSSRRECEVPQGLNQRVPKRSQCAACPSTYLNACRMPRTIRLAPSQLRCRLFLAVLSAAECSCLPHLSDSHLSPLQAPCWSSLPASVRSGSINRRRKRHCHPSQRLARPRTVADLQGPRARPRRGDRRSRQPLARQRICAPPPGSPRSALRATSRSCRAITTPMCAPLSPSAGAFGRLYARRRCRGRCVSVRTPASPARADRPVERGADRTTHRDRAAWGRADRASSPRCSSLCRARVVSRRADPSSAAEQAVAPLHERLLDGPSAHVRASVTFRHDRLARLR